MQYLSLRSSSEMLDMFDESEIETMVYEHLIDIYG
ncbi:hypothetical protein [Limosilactobacillus equigenerosi]